MRARCTPATCSRSSSSWSRTGHCSSSSTTTSWPRRAWRTMGSAAAFPPALRPHRRFELQHEDRDGRPRRARIERPGARSGAGGELSRFRMEHAMTLELLTQIYVFVLAVFVGFEVISKVPVVLHTPLMSGTNAIHGIVVIGGILVLRLAEGPVTRLVAFVAVVFGAANLVGGLLVTDRMLHMFRKRPGPPA